MFLLVIRERREQNNPCVIPWIDHVLYGNIAAFGGIFLRCGSDPWRQSFLSTHFSELLTSLPSFSLIALSKDWSARNFSVSGIKMCPYFCNAASRLNKEAVIINEVICINGIGFSRSLKHRKFEESRRPRSLKPLITLITHGKHLVNPSGNVILKSDKSKYGWVFLKVIYHTYLQECKKISFKKSENVFRKKSHSIDKCMIFV